MLTDAAAIENGLPFTLPVIVPVPSPESIPPVPGPIGVVITLAPLSVAR